MSKQQHDSEQYRQALGEYAYIYGATAAAVVFKCTEDRARYWAKKFVDPTFHPNTHGGFRNSKFSKQDERRCHGLIWALMKKKPDLDTGTLIQVAAAAGFDLNTTYIYRLFKLWGWTRKAPILKQFK